MSQNQPKLDKISQRTSAEAPIKEAPIKISFISGTYPPIHCGIGDYTAHLAEALTELPDEIKPKVTIITTNQAEPIKGSRVNLAGFIERWNWKELRRILHWLFIDQPEIIHFQYPTILYGRHPAITFLPLLVRGSSLFRPRWSPKCLLTIHEYTSFRLLGKIRIWLMALFCEAIITVTPEGNKNFRVLRFLGKYLAYIPVGNNISLNLPPDYAKNPLEWRREHDLVADCPTIAYFGFVSPSKGLSTLVEAFSRLESKAQLLLITEPKAQDTNYQDYFDQLDQLIKSKNLEQKILWTGFVSEAEVSAYLRSATLVAFPYTDGVSVRRTSLLAALANGVAVISTFPQNPHQAQGLANGENIWLVKAEDAVALSEALQELLANPALRQSIAKKGQELISQFSWPAIAFKHIELYRVLQNRKVVSNSPHK